MLKHPKSIRETIPTKCNFFINPREKINLDNRSRYLFSISVKRSIECDKTISKKNQEALFFSNPVRLQFNLYPFIYPVATQIVKESPSLYTTTGIKNEPVSAISMEFAIISRHYENYRYT